MEVRYSATVCEICNILIMHYSDIAIILVFTLAIGCMISSSLTMYSKMHQRVFYTLCGCNFIICHVNPFVPDFKNLLKIHKSLIYWYILKIFTGLVGMTLDLMMKQCFFCIKTSITKYPGLITPSPDHPGVPKKNKINSQPC
jgi:hypothetical protein